MCDNAHVFMFISDGWVVIGPCGRMADELFNITLYQVVMSYHVLSYHVL